MEAAPAPGDLAAAAGPGSGGPVAPGAGGVSPAVPGELFPHRPPGPHPGVVGSEGGQLGGQGRGLPGLGVPGVPRVGGVSRLPVLLFGVAWQCHRQGLDYLTWTQVISSLALLAGTTGLLSLAHPYISWGQGLIHSGGGLGNVLVAGLAGLLNRPGAVLALSLVFLLGAHGDHPPVPGGTAVPPGKAGPAGLVGLNRRRAPEDPGHGPAHGSHPRCDRPSSPGPR